MGTTSIHAYIMVQKIKINASKNLIYMCYIRQASYLLLCTVYTLYVCPCIYFQN